MKYSKLFLLAIFIPLLLFFIFVSIFSIESLYQLSIQSSSDILRYEQFIKGSTMELDETTLFIIKNNSLVAIILWFIPLFIWFIFCRNKEIDFLRKRYVTKVLVFCYAFFFIKESVRIIIVLYEFQISTGIPYLISFFTLLIPHGLLEFFSFMLIAHYGIEWFNKQMYSTQPFFKPKLIHILLPLFLLVIAAIIETTITPFCFQKGLDYYLTLNRG